VPVILRYPDRDGETFGVCFNERHQWKYLRGMTPDEGVLIKWCVLILYSTGHVLLYDVAGCSCVLQYSFDSVQDGSVAAFTPHTGFEDPTTPPNAPKRESIELRALVFYD